MAVSTGVRAGAASSTSNVRPVGLVAPVCVVAGVVVALVVLLVTLPWWLALVLGVVVAAALGWWLLHTAEHAAVGGVAMREANEADEPRLFNMIDGLCDSHGFRRPRVMVIDDPARNAVVFGHRSESATLAITKGWLDALGRMGLEGVLARELACANHAGLPAATVAASVTRVLPGSLGRRTVRKVTGPYRALLDDFDAVRYTKYPPGLAEALAVAAQGSQKVTGAPARGAHLWVAAPVTVPPTDDDVASLEARVDALREL